MNVFSLFLFISFLISLILVLVSTFFQVGYPFFFSFLFVILAYPTYKLFISSLNHKTIFGFLFISIFISILFFSLGEQVSYFLDFEEISVHLRYKLLKGQIGKTVISLEQTYIEKFDPPKDARKDIQIIGIKTETIEKLNGDWPIHWIEYAKLIRLFKETNNILFFDIFFLDEKEVEADILSEALKGSRNVIVDYSIESNSASKTSIENYKEKLEIINKFKLLNVTDDEKKDSIWLDFPIPPILRVSKYVSGLGFANVKKEGNLANRKMPLIAKILQNVKISYYPSVDLVIICNYFGVDVVKDTEIKMGSYVKIKNIPTIFLNDRDGTKRDILTKPDTKREITIPIDSYGQMEINFVGSLFSFKDEDLYDVANEWNINLASNYEKNIFLVGMYYASGLTTAKDTHLSPYGEMSGVEHHAHALNTILNQNFVKHIPKSLDLFIFVISGLLLTYSLYKFSTRYSVLFFLSILVVYTLIVFSFFYFNSLILPFGNILINALVIFISINAYKVLSEEENTKYIKSTFSKFVSKDVVEELLKNPAALSLGGAKKEITIFFSDIRGFTTLSEQLSPEELVTILNEYLSVMTDSLVDYKGTIDKYIGDAIMAFWGAPVQLEEHSYYACVAALVQLQKLEILQKSWSKRRLPKIDIGIGLNTGEAIVGNMGSSLRMDFTCIGDAVNLASRLENSNKNYGTKIIISEFTYEKVKDKIYARELDLVKVKGKNMPVRIYELLDLKNKSDFKTYRQVIN